MDWFSQLEDSEIEIIELSVNTPAKINTRELQFDLLKRQFLAQLPRRIADLESESTFRGRRLALARLASEANRFGLFDLWRLALHMLDRLRSTEPQALRDAWRNLKAEAHRLRG